MLFGGLLVELIEAGRTLIWPSSFRRGGIFSSRFPGWRGGGWSGHGCISRVFPRAKGIEIHWSLQLSSGVILHKLRSWGFYQQPQGKWSNKRQKIGIAEDGSELFACEPEPMRSMAATLVLFLSAGASNVWGRQIIPFFKTDIETTSVPKKLQDSQRLNQTRRVPTKNRKQIVKCHHLKTTFAKQRCPPKNLASRSMLSTNCARNPSGATMSASTTMLKRLQPLTRSTTVARRCAPRPGLGEGRAVLCFVAGFCHWGVWKTVINSVFVFVITYFSAFFKHNIYI